MLIKALFDNCTAFGVLLAFHGYLSIESNFLYVNHLFKLIQFVGNFVLVEIEFSLLQEAHEIDSERLTVRSVLLLHISVLLVFL